jgi:hypothetical protein
MTLAVMTEGGRRIVLPVIDGVWQLKILWAELQLFFVRANQYCCCLLCSMWLQLYINLCYKLNTQQMATSGE